MTENSRGKEPNGQSPACELAELEARWAAAYAKDEFGSEAAILGNMVLRARAGLSPECNSSPLREQPDKPGQAFGRFELVRASGTLFSMFVRTGF